MNFLKLKFISFSEMLEVFHGEGGKKFFNNFDKHVFFMSQKNFLI